MRTPSLRAQAVTIVAAPSARARAPVHRFQVDPVTPAPSARPVTIDAAAPALDGRSVVHLHSERADEARR